MCTHGRSVLRIAGRRRAEQEGLGDTDMLDAVTDFVHEAWQLANRIDAGDAALQLHDRLAQAAATSPSDEFAHPLAKALPEKADLRRLSSISKGIYLHATRFDAVCSKGDALEAIEAMLSTEDASLQSRAIDVLEAGSARGTTDEEKRAMCERLCSLMGRPAAVEIKTRAHAANERLLEGMRDTEKMSAFRHLISTAKSPSVIAMLMARLQREVARAFDDQRSELRGPEPISLAVDVIRASFDDQGSNLRASTMSDAVAGAVNVIRFTLLREEASGGDPMVVKPRLQRLEAMLTRIVDACERAPRSPDVDVLLHVANCCLAELRKKSS